MYGLLDRLLWIPKSEVDVDKIKLAMTAISSGFSGGRVIPLYEETENEIGVPRHWGVKNIKLDGLVDATTYPKLDWPKFQWPEGWNWREGQLECIDHLVKRFTKDIGAGLDVACGFGKTLVALKVAEALQTSALVLVHRSELADQWAKVVKYGYIDDRGKTIVPFYPDMELGFIQGNKFKCIKCPLTIAMVQTLHARKEALLPDFWKQFGLIIVEEVHLYPADSLEKILRQFHARYRLGISATWRRKDGLECIWRYHITDSLHRPKLERQGGKFKQIYWQTKYTDHEIFDYGQWVDVIISNKHYNDWLVDQMIASSVHGRKMLLCSTRRDHCLHLKRLFDEKVTVLNMKDKYDAAIFMGNGADFKMSRYDKDQAKKAQNIIATSQMISVGVDIPAFDTLLLAVPLTDIEQIVGRISRVRSDKKVLKVIDPIFNTEFNKKLANRRKNQLIRLGFEEMLDKPVVAQV